MIIKHHILKHHIPELRNYNMCSLLCVCSVTLVYRDELSEMCMLISGFVSSVRAIFFGVYIYIYMYIYIYIYTHLSLSLHIYLSLSLSIYIYSCYHTVPESHICYTIILYFIILYINDGACKTRACKLLRIRTPALS